VSGKHFQPQSDCDPSRSCPSRQIARSIKQTGARRTAHAPASSVMQLSHARQKFRVKSSRCSGHGSTLPCDHIFRHLDWLPSLAEFNCGDDSSVVLGQLVLKAAGVTFSSWQFPFLSTTTIKLPWQNDRHSNKKHLGTQKPSDLECKVS
jgi:hypothetical protein